MSNLTDADKKSFIDKIIGTLNQADTKSRLTAKGWDPAVRLTSLENGVSTVTEDEGLISQLEAALTSAINNRRNDLDNNYALASATVSSVEGALGKNDPLVEDLRQFRGSLNHESQPKPVTP